MAERVRSSIALQIRALREQRNQMTQKQLGELLGKAQAWISKLEDPDYGKVTVATLLEIAGAFDTDLEIKFRPFSTFIRDFPLQGANYFKVASFEEEALDDEEVTSWDQPAKLFAVPTATDTTRNLSRQAISATPFVGYERKGMSLEAVPRTDASTNMVTGREVVS